MPADYPGCCRRHPGNRADVPRRRGVVSGRADAGSGVRGTMLSVEQGLGKLFGDRRSQVQKFQRVDNLILPVHGHCTESCRNAVAPDKTESDAPLLRGSDAFGVVGGAGALRGALQFRRLPRRS